jgi:hypothetical protein
MLVSQAKLFPELFYGVNHDMSPRPSRILEYPLVPEKNDFPQATEWLGKNPAAYQAENPCRLAFSRPLGTDLPLIHRSGARSICDPYIPTVHFLLVIFESYNIK